MRKGIYIIPNTLTLCGMFAGFYSILASVRADFVSASWAVLIAMVFDGLDGWVARRTHSTTRFGIELDSLSDVIAFGVAPAVLLFRWDLIAWRRLGWAVAFIYAACGALRLARFNVQMGSAEKKSFTGLPIPGGAFVAAATVLFYREMNLTPHKSLFILLLTFVVSVLMISTINYHSIKEIDFSKRRPFWLLVVPVIFLALVVSHPEITLFCLAIAYLLSGPIEAAILYYLRKSPEQSS